MASGVKWKIESRISLLLAIEKQFVDIPAKFEPRWYQEPFMKAMDEGCQRAVCVWHRRAGKDKTFVNQCVKAMTRRVGTYYYYFPTMTMGRKIFWDGMDRLGMAFLEHFPPEFVKARNNQEMKITAVNGSIFQVIGTDRLDVVGTNPVGCVFSEYSLQNPKGWDYVRPILAENNGWAVFNFTPRGKNHGYDLYQMALGNPLWFCEKLDVDDTQAITLEAIQAERDSGMSEDMVQQEFYCSFEVGQEGSYYAKLMAEAFNDGRVGFNPAESIAKVYTFWDLGVDDDTAIWFAQFIGREIRLIDYYAYRGEGMNHYAKVLQELPYQYNTHFVPHDALQRMQGREVSRRLDILRELLKQPVEVVEPHGIADGIEYAKGIFRQCRFDSVKCASGIKCLENYRQKYDEVLKKYCDHPLHDWSSHAADAFRYLAYAYRHQIDVDGAILGYTGANPAVDRPHNVDMLSVG